MMMTTTTITLNDDDYDIVCDICKLPLSLSEVEENELTPIIINGYNINILAEQMYRCSKCKKDKSRNKRKREVANNKSFKREMIM